MEVERAGEVAQALSLKLVLPRGPLGAMAPRSGIYRIGL